MNDRITIKLYRHRHDKTVFLARNWNLCGGSDAAPFYYATKDVMRAILDANRNDFESWMSHFPGKDNKTKLVAKMTDSKTVDFDGYKGTITKELEFRVKDFELVELTEVSGDG